MIVRWTSSANVMLISFWTDALNCSWNVVISPSIELSMNRFVYWYWHFAVYDLHYWIVRCSLLICLWDSLGTILWKNGIQIMDCPKKLRNSLRDLKAEWQRHWYPLYARTFFPLETTRFFPPFWSITTHLLSWCHYLKHVPTTVNDGLEWNKEMCTILIAIVKNIYIVLFNTKEITNWFMHQKNTTNFLVWKGFNI